MLTVTNNKTVGNKQNGICGITVNSGVEEGVSIQTPSILVPFSIDFTQEFGLSNTSLSICFKWLLLLQLPSFVLSTSVFDSIATFLERFTRDINTVWSLLNTILLFIT